MKGNLKIPVLMLYFVGIFSKIFNLLSDEFCVKHLCGICVVVQIEWQVRV